MSFEIRKGLYALDTFEDHHAALGLPVDAEPAQVRKRYLRVARKLHPDSLVGCDPDDKQKATDVLSKLVNPAYEMLYQDKNRKEYLLSVRLRGQQVHQQRDQLTGGLGEAAKKLFKAPNLDGSYHQMVKALADQQFESLDRITDVVGTLSELNLVYLLRKEGKGQVATQPEPVAPIDRGTGGKSIPGRGTEDNGPSTIIQPNPFPMRSLADGYLRRAEEYLRKQAHSQAILELRDGLRAAPQDSRCHSLMGIIYLQQNQATMAKVSIRKALELNPNDLRALEGRRKLASMGHKIELSSEADRSAGDSSSTESPSKGSRKKNNSKSNNKPDKGGGGLFGGIFGGGKSKRK